MHRSLATGLGPNPIRHPIPLFARFVPLSTRQRGSFALGLVVGLLIGLALALGVALYITKTPIPFTNKVPQRSADQDAAETRRNQGWDPNAPLAGKAPRPVTPAASAAPPAEPASAAQGSRDPAALLSGAAPPAQRPGTVVTSAAPASAPKAASSVQEPYQYFVQAGAFQRAEDAEAQRAKLGMLGVEARVFEREQSGRTVHRVRVGPLERQAEAESLRARLGAAGLETTIIRVDRSPQ